MAENIDLNIKIGANVTDLQSQLQKAENLLRQFEAALKKATNVGEINYLNNSIKNLNTTISTLGQQMNKVGKPAGDATQSLINFSRIAQDAPYGIMGIANNLNPMLESFQQLAKTEGGTKKALSAMVEGLAGPAGIGVALGLASSLAVVFQKQITEAFAGPAEKLKDLREELKKLNDEIYRMAGSAQASQTLGTELVGRITNQNLSVSQRENALKKFKELYSKNKEIQALEIKDLKNYNAQFLQSLNNKAAVQQLEISKEQNYVDALSAANSKYKKLTEERDNLKKNTYATTKQIEMGTTTEMLRSQIDAQFVKPLKEAQKDIDNAKASLARTLDVTTLYGTPDTKKGGTKEAKKDPFTEITKDFQTSLNAQKTLRSNSIIDQQTYLDNVYKIYEDYIKKLAELDTKQATDKIENLLPKFDKMTLEKNAKEIKDGINKGLATFQAPELEAPPKDTAIEDLKKQREDYLKWLTGWTKYKEKLAQDNIDNENKKLEELNKSYEQFANTISQTVTNAIFSMYDAMQEGASATEALDAMFQRLVRQLAEMAIKAAIFAGIMSAISGGAAGGGISFGVAFKKILGLADGGVATGPTLAMIGEGSESEAVLPLSKLGNIMQSSFNAGSMSGYGGGNGGGVAVLRGQDLLIALNRTQKASSLKGQNISLA
jgi:hypothetical protein